jgi:hypothetical protein
MYRHVINIVFVSVVFLSAGCKRSNHHFTKVTNAMPDSIASLRNLKVYHLNKAKKKAWKVKFKQTQVFESSKHIYINGLIGPVAVDNQNRVYIVGLKPGNVAIYLFQPDGRFITKIGGYVRGRGEFESISSIIAENNKLYVFDSRQQKISIFSLKNDSLVAEHLIRQKSLTKLSLGNYRAHDMVAVNNNGDVLLRFDPVRGLFHINKNRRMDYLRLSDKGKLKPEIILNQKNVFYFEPSQNDLSRGNHMPRRMPFSFNSLIAVSNHFIYTNRTDKILIKVYNKKGKYERAIYYPYDNSKLNVSTLNLGRYEYKLIREHKNKVPETWPAVHTIFVDDQNRPWVLTITDSDSTYKGWVLNEEGKLLARFMWPGRRGRSIPGIKPLMIVKNGFLYTHMQNIRKGIDRIVKWEITFVKNGNE